MIKKKQQKSVLFICYYFPPMGMGGTQRVAKFAKYLPKFQWEPYVVTVKDVHYYAHDDTLLNELKHVQIFRTESLDPLRLLVRFKHKKKEIPQTSNTRTHKNILNFLNETIGSFFFIPDSKILWLPFAIFKSYQLIRRYKIKVIFTTSPPHSAHIAGFILKLFLQMMWVADFRDDWTGGESQPCPTRFHSIINRFQEKLVLRYADRIVGMCEHLTHVLHRKNGVPSDKFITIMNGYDREDFQPVLDTKLNQTFTITHCGSISRVSNPEPFIKALKLLIDEDEGIATNIQAQFVGTDIYSQLDDLVTRYNLQQIIRPIQYLPHQESLKRLMASHVLLITVLKKTDEEIITGKIFEYLGSGKPILLISKGGYVAETIMRLKRGHVIAENDIIGIKNSVHYYYDKFQERKLEFYKPLTVPEFDRENLTKQLADLFNEITGR